MPPFLRGLCCSVLRACNWVYYMSPLNVTKTGGANHRWCFKNPKEGHEYRKPWVTNSSLWANCPIIPINHHFCGNLEVTSDLPRSFGKKVGPLPITPFMGIITSVKPIYAIYHSIVGAHGHVVFFSPFGWSSHRMTVHCTCIDSLVLTRCFQHVGFLLGFLMLWVVNTCIIM